MQKFLLAVRAKNEPESLDDIFEAVRNKELDASWIDEYRIHGEYDAIHVFETADKETATKVATAVRTQTGNYVDLWPVVEGKPNPVDEASRESFPASDAPSFSP